jgi:hypothetical protein
MIPYSDQKFKKNTYFRTWNIQGLQDVTIEYYEFKCKFM